MVMADSGEGITTGFPVKKNEQSRFLNNLSKSDITFTFAFPQCKQALRPIPTE